MKLLIIFLNVSRMIQQQFLLDKTVNINSFPFSSNHDHKDYINLEEENTQIQYEFQIF